MATKQPGEKGKVEIDFGKSVLSDWGCYQNNPKEFYPNAKLISMKQLQGDQSANGAAQKYLEAIRISSASIDPKRDKERYLGFVAGWQASLNQSVKQGQAEERELKSKEEIWDEISNLPEAIDEGWGDTAMKAMQAYADQFQSPGQQEVKDKEIELLKAALLKTDYREELERDVAYWKLEANAKFQEIERLKEEAIELLDWVLNNRYKVDIIHNELKWVLREGDDKDAGYYREVTSQQLYKLFKQSK